MAEARLDYVRDEEPLAYAGPNSRLAAVALSSARAQPISVTLVAIVAVLLRLTPLFFGTGSDRFMDPNGDSRTYIELARGLRHGCGFARFADGHCLAAETNRTPGYPLFLAITPRVRSALAAQALLAGIVTFVAGAFVAALWGSAAGLLCTTLIALDLPSIVLSNEIMTEAVFTALFVFGIIAELHALWRARGRSRRIVSLLAASAFFVYAILVRPLGEFALAAPFLIAIARVGSGWRQRLGYALLVISIPAALIAGWSARNYRIAGSASFSSIGGLNFFYYRAGGTLAYASGTHWAAELGKLTTPNQAQLLQGGFAIIARHPMAFARMTAWSLLYLCLVPERSPLSHLLGIQRSFAPEEPGSMRLNAALRGLATSPRAALHAIYRDEFQSSPMVLTLTVFQVLLTLLMWAGVMAGLKLCGLRAYRDFCMASFMAGALVLLLLAAGPEATARFRVPAIPLLAMAAGVGLSGGSRASEPLERGARMRATAIK